MMQKKKWKKICIGLLAVLCMLGIFVFAIGYLSTLGNQHRIAQLDAVSDLMVLLEQEDQYQFMLKNNPGFHPMVEPEYQQWLEKTQVLRQDDTLKPNYYTDDKTHKNKIYRAQVQQDPLKYLTEEIVYPKASPSACGSACYQIGAEYIPSTGPSMLRAQLDQTWVYVFVQNPGAQVLVYHPETGVKQYNFPDLIFSYQNKYRIKDQGIEIRGPDLHQNYSFIRISADQVVGEWRKAQNQTNQKQCKSVFKQIDQSCAQLISCKLSTIDATALQNIDSPRDLEEVKLQDAAAKIQLVSILHQPGLNRPQLLANCQKRCEQQTIWYWNFKSDVCYLAD